MGRLSFHKDKRRGSDGFFANGALGELWQRTKGAAKASPEVIPPPPFPPDSAAERRRVPESNQNR